MSDDSNDFGFAVPLPNDENGKFKLGALDKPMKFLIQLAKDPDSIASQEYLANPAKYLSQAVSKLFRTAKEADGYVKQAMNSKSEGDIDSHIDEKMKEAVEMGLVGPNDSKEDLVWLLFERQLQNVTSEILGMPRPLRSVMLMFLLIMEIDNKSEIFNEETNEFMSGAMMQVKDRLYGLKSEFEALAALPEEERLIKMRELLQKIQEIDKDVAHKAPRSTEDAAREALTKARKSMNS